MRGAGYMRGLAVLALALLFIGAVLSVDWPNGEVTQNETVTNQDVGSAMFGESGSSGYGLVMLFIGVLLLVALLGGIFLAKEERGDEP